MTKQTLIFFADSVILSVKEGEWIPPLGDYLGELTSELDEGDHIVQFVSSGPKSYAYKTALGKECCKLKGFTLNAHNQQLINFDSMKEIVQGQREKITIKGKKITRNKRKLYNRDEEKDYKLVYTKRRIVDNYDTVPYGYVHN